MVDLSLNSVAKPSRRHASAEKRRAQIIEAALGCFSSDGYHATTMDNLAGAAGLSKGSLYWHFESKEDVFLALFDHIAAEVFGRFDEAARSGNSNIVSLLRSEIEIFHDRFGDERELLLAWAEFINHPRGRERIAEIQRLTRAKLAGVVRVGITRGELREMPPESVAAVLAGIVDALILQAAVDTEFDVRKHSETLWELICHGIASVRTRGEAQAKNKRQERTSE